MNIYVLVFLSFVIGTVYYYIMESSIPKNSNCSFISSIWTDILAFVAGIIIIYRSYIYQDSILALLGGAIITEHIWQLFPKFTMNKFI